MTPLYAFTIAPVKTGPFVPLPSSVYQLACVECKAAKPWTSVPACTPPSCPPCTPPFACWVSHEMVNQYSLFRQGDLVNWVILSRRCHVYRLLQWKTVQDPYMPNLSQINGPSYSNSGVLSSVALVLRGVQGLALIMHVSTDLLWQN